MLMFCNIINIITLIHKNALLRMTKKTSPKKVQNYGRAYFYPVQLDKICAKS